MKIIILDRDGVINQEFLNQCVVKEEEFIPIPKSLEAIAALKQAGYIVVVATNQSIIAKKIVSLKELEKIHNKLQNLLAIYKVKIDNFFFVPTKNLIIVSVANQILECYWKLLKNIK